MSCLPNIKITKEIYDRRARENEWGALQIQIDRMITNLNHPLDITEFFRCLQISLTNRQGMIPDLTPEHINIQEDVNLLEILISNTCRSYKLDGKEIRKIKLMSLQMSILKLKVER